MRSPRRLPFLALALVAALMTGCGRAPTAPVVTPEPVASQAAKPAAAEAGLIGDLVGRVARLVVRTLHLVGSLGGSLTNGRWTVVLPPGAVDGNGQVTLAVANAASADCHLEIFPRSLNDFSVPVTLTASCASVPASELADYVIYWYDPAARRWVEQPSEVNLAARTVSARLSHFSMYSVGKKGGKASW